MLSPEKSRLLRSFLSQLPEKTAARLADVVEADRLAGGSSLPHQLILDVLHQHARVRESGMSSDVLVGRIELHADAIRSARHPSFDAEALVEHLAQFTELSSQLCGEGNWGDRLKASRAAVAETMDGFMERAPTEISIMIPVLNSGRYAGGPVCVDLSGPVDEESAQRGLRYAKLLAGCAPYAAMGAFAAAQQDAMRAVGMHLRGYNDDIIREMRAPAGEPEPAAARQIERAAALTALILGPEETEFLLRRAWAAMNAQAAATA